jgi:hypothetical protein
MITEMVFVGILVITMGPQDSEVNACGIEGRKRCVK